MAEQNIQQISKLQSEHLSHYTSAFELLSEQPIFGLTRQQKNEVLLPTLQCLQHHHAESCPEYANAIGLTNLADSTEIDNLPYLAVRLFKLLNLKSIAEDDIYRTLRSSGTTGQVTAKIALDKQTSQRQSKALVAILQQVLGKQRLPMLIIDAPSTVRRGAAFNARAAGIQGLMFFGKDHTYALHDDMSLNIAELTRFTEKYHNVPVLVFGFTFMVWQYFVRQLELLNESLKLSQAIMLHSGGWKKLESEKVDNLTFKKRLRNATGIQTVHNFYGMAEQVGSIFVECSEGHLHAPVMADIIARRTTDLEPCEYGELGILQVLSAIPSSYPGHSILTEDLGIILGEDDCACGWKGRYFTVIERLPKAEIRGCSDTHAESVRASTV